MDREVRRKTTPNQNVSDFLRKQDKKTGRLKVQDLCSGQRRRLLVKVISYFLSRYKVQKCRRREPFYKKGLPECTRGIVVRKSRSVASLSVDSPPAAGKPPLRSVFFRTNLDQNRCLPVIYRGRLTPRGRGDVSDDGRRS